jgi:hypothetical protein
VPISGKPEIGAPPQDEASGFKLHPPDPIGFMDSIHLYMGLHELHGKITLASPKAPVRTSIASLHQDRRSASVSE